MRFDFLNAPVPSAFDPRKHLPGFESLKRAKKARNRLVMELKKGGPKSNKIAAQLAKCHLIKRPCRLACCPVCVRRFRSLWTAMICDLIREKGGEWCVVSIVPPADIYTVGKLHKYRIRSAKERLRKRLKRSLVEDPIVIGGVDVALKVLKSGRYVWHPHFYLVIQASDEEVRKTLGKIYKSNSHTRYPVIVKALGCEDSDLLEVASYTYKIIFDQKERGFDWSGREASIDKPLDPTYWPELSIALNKWGFGCRIVRHNLGEDESRLRFR
jgi:hypothetical protein